VCTRQPMARPTQTTTTALMIWVSISAMDSGVDPDDPATRDERFQFGLDCVLDGIAARLDQRALRDRDYAPFARLTLGENFSNARAVD
jgi:hypothetical protein